MIISLCETVYMWSTIYSKNLMVLDAGVFGQCKYVYYGKHSEGNRFIRNNQLWLNTPVSNFAIIYYYRQYSVHISLEVYRDTTEHSHVRIHITVWKFVFGKNWQTVLLTHEIWKCKASNPTTTLLERKKELPWMGLELMTLLNPWHCVVNQSSWPT